MQIQIRKIVTRSCCTCKLCMVVDILAIIKLYKLLCFIYKLILTFSYINAKRTLVCCENACFEVARLVLPFVSHPTYTDD